MSGALTAYHELSRRLRPPLQTAGGEGAHEPFMARNLIDVGRVGYIQIDAGRIGGITSAHEIARYAADHTVTYVNHTFTTPLALSASLQPYAGLREHHLCEYPVEASPLAETLTREKIPVGPDGQVSLPEGVGLGMTPDPATIRKYLQPVEIRVGGRLLYETLSI